MLDPSFQLLELPAPIEDAGYAYGRSCTHLLERARLDRYLQSMAALKRTDTAAMARHAAAWAARLPVHFRQQMQAMADGAGAAIANLECLLYADIAPPASAAGDGPLTLVAGDGPMCSGVVVEHAGRPWVARNCDWYEATLQRGTAAVFHRVPGRIPCVAVGLLGDIDADTGMNAEGLWLHMHTLQAADDLRPGVSCISWLFWMREALETCATLDDVQRFIERTDRDRGVMLFAADGRRNESAIFECSRSGYRRIDPWQVGPHRALLATNHPHHKHPTPAEALVRGSRRESAGNGTVSRYCRLHALLADEPADHLPDDLVEVLADERVELRPGRGSSHLRTIYAAVADPGGRGLWFASGACPAASQGEWRRIDVPW
jgi:hypothetical protein